MNNKGEKGAKEQFIENIPTILERLNRESPEDRTIIYQLDDLYQNAANLTIAEILVELDFIKCVANAIPADETSINENHKSQFRRQISILFSKFRTAYADKTVTEEALKELKAAITNLSVFPSLKEFRKIQNIVDALQHDFFINTPDIKQQCPLLILSLLKLNYVHRGPASEQSGSDEQKANLKKYQHLNTYKKSFENAFMIFGGILSEKTVDLKALDEEQKKLLGEIIRQQLEGNQLTNNKIFKLRKSDTFYIGAPPNITCVKLSNSLIIRMENNQPIMEIVGQSLGKGGMGSVKEVYGYIEPHDFKVILRKPDEQLAVKIMDPAVDTDTVAREGQVTEELLGAKPIVNRDAKSKYHTLQTKHYMFMPKVNGEPLNKIELAKFNLEQLIDIAINIAKEVQKIHGKNQVHLDLNPSNILVDDSGKVTIIDFGFTLRLNSTQQAAGYTPYYSSPEIRESCYKRTSILITPKSDIYSLGKIFFQGRFSDLFKTKSELNIAEQFIQLSNRMYNEKYDERPTLNIVLNKLAKIKAQIKEEILHKNQMPGL